MCPFVLSKKSGESFFKILKMDKNKCPKLKYWNTLPQKVF